MTCPICAKDTDKSYRPFCSRRCADIDLGRWMSEDYRVPSEETPALEDLSDPHPMRPQ